VFFNGSCAPAGSATVRGAPAGPFDRSYETKTENRGAVVTEMSKDEFYQSIIDGLARYLQNDFVTDISETAKKFDDPYIAYARAQALFHPVRWPEPGIDPQARVADDAVVEGATVEAFAWIGPGARVGEGSWIQAGAYVGRGTTLGRDCRLMPGSVVMEECALGDRVWLNPGAIVGEMAYYTRQPANASVIAETEVVAYALSETKLDGLLATNPRLAAEIHRRMARSLSRRVTETNTALRKAMD